VTKVEAKAILDAERQAMEEDAAETVSAKPVMAK
jgi:SSS family solute:Na+ symporter